MLQLRKLNGLLIIRAATVIERAKAWNGSDTIKLKFKAGPVPAFFMQTSEEIAMAKIKLYKFRPLSDCKDFERIEKILETGEFWCPKFTELNDPMEGVYTLDWEYREDVRKIYNKKTVLIQ